MIHQHTHDPETMLSLKEFLEANVAVQQQLYRTSINGYSSIADFVLRNGREFTEFSDVSVKTGNMKQCYKNCAEVAIGRDDLFYCEGYACGIIPVLHAWLCDSHGRIIDPTWTGQRGRPPRGTAYFGVVIKKRYWMALACKTECYGVIDRWDGCPPWPILKDDPSLWKEELHETTTHNAVP